MLLEFPCHFMPDSFHGAGGESPAAGKRSLADGRLPVAGEIDLSGPGGYEGNFVIEVERGSERRIELRIGEAGNYVFLSVHCASMMAELSSGFSHGGARCESSHGVCSGGCMARPLLLHCVLKVSESGLVVEARVKGDDADGETLIFGSAKFAGVAPNGRASVQLCDRATDQELSWREQVRRAGEIASAENGDSENGMDMKTRKPSRVRLCEADQWYEYEAPSIGGA